MINKEFVSSTLSHINNLGGTISPHLLSELRKIYNVLYDKNLYSALLLWDVLQVLQETCSEHFNKHFLYSRKKSYNK